MFRVRLPKNFVPRFPAACVGCGCAEEKRLRGLADPRIGTWLATEMEMGGPLAPALPLVMPLCSPCEEETRRRTFRLSVARPVGAVIGILAMVGLLVALELPEDGSPWELLAFVAGALLGAWCGHAFALHHRPPPVRVVGSGPRSIEFRDPERARAFAAANDFEVLPASVWRI